MPGRVGVRQEQSRTGLVLFRNEFSPQLLTTLDGERDSRNDKAPVLVNAGRTKIVHIRT